MATQTASRPSSSSSCTDPRWRHDVYLSCSGEDTPKSFTDPLHAALTRKGIGTFRFSMEEEFNSQVIFFEAIENSRFSIVVLSRKYAHSIRCLDELAKIVECMKKTGQTVLPVYYDVDQAEVQKQCENFGNASPKHFQFYIDHGEKVPSWRDALVAVANLPRWDVLDPYKTQDIELIVKVVGTELHSPSLGNPTYGRSLYQWDKESLEKKKTDAVKTSIQGLDDNERRIFLDIVCFFIGMEKERVEEILDGNDCCPSIAIENLINNSLITILDNKVMMNRLIQETGEELVRAESPGDPGKRSRLSVPDDIRNVLENNKGTKAVEGIDIDFPTFEETEWNSRAFSNMPCVRFLRIQNVGMAQGPEYLSDALTYLEWSDYPAESLPQGFQPNKLHELNLCYGNIEQIWYGIKYLYELKTINVSHSQNLTRMPDFSGTPNLEKLVFEGCISLEEIHPTIHGLKRLKLLNLKGCTSLKVLPDTMAMKSLERFILSGCSNVTKIPDFVVPMDHLSELSLDETDIEGLPLSIEHLTALTLLNLRDCKNLKCLPSDIHKLKALKSLNISGCSRLEDLPDNLGKIKCLEELDVGGTSICDLPLPIFSLENLKVLSLKGLPRKRTGPLGLLLPGLSGLSSLSVLNLSGCKFRDGTIPYDLGCLVSLALLDVSKSNCSGLPTSTKQLSKLQSVKLEDCKSLQKLPDLSSSIDFSVGSDSHPSQEKLSCSSNLFRMGDSCFNFINCSKLVGNQDCNNIVFTLLRRFLKGNRSPGCRFETIIPGSEIPEFFCQSSGYVVSMNLSQHWYKNKWMGYAVCAVFALRPYCTANMLGRWKFGIPSLGCEVKPNKLDVPGSSPFLGCREELGRIESDHLWFAFVPGEYFGTEWQNICRHLEFVFKTIGTGLEVKNCGVRLIYEQDFEDRKLIMTQSRGIVSSCEVVNRSEAAQGTIVQQSCFLRQTGGTSNSKQDDAPSGDIHLSKRSRN